MRRILALAFVISVLSPAGAWAQGFDDPLRGINQQIGGPIGDGDLVTASGYFTAAPDGKRGTLYIEAESQLLWHFYSITQGPGGPLPTNLKVTEAAGFKVTGEFKTLTPPHAHPEPAFGGIIVEEHDQATWSVPIEFADGVDAKTLKITGAVNAMVCKEGTCMPPTDYKFAAAFNGIEEIVLEEEPEGPATFKPAISHVEWVGGVDTKSVAPGGTFTIQLFAKLAPQWHLYEFLDAPTEELGGQPTLIKLHNLPSGWTSTVNVAGELISPIDGSRPYYEGEVTFDVAVTVPENAEPGTHSVAGMVAFATCDAMMCDPPDGLAFSRQITVAADATATPGPLGFRVAGYNDVVAAFTSNTTANTDVSTSGSDQALSGIDRGALDSSSSSAPEAAGAASVTEFATWMGLAFLAGLLLNVMPCVLPVIGIKIKSFVQQSGEKRSQAFMLNVWFSLGLMFVFAILGVLAVVLGQAFGSQFQSTGFILVMSGIVFAFALSLLGIWEIPIPGFVGSSKANELADREGPAGAFSKGILTTLLATPCIGPLLVPALGWAVGQSAVVGFSAFIAVGLGMASPYLLLGAFPQLVKKVLPKPGGWMETFKQCMGFVLLATVIWLMTSLDFYDLIPALSTFVGIWFGCWLIGKSQMSPEAARKAIGWAGAAASIAAVTAFSFYYLDRWQEEKYEWKFQMKVFSDASFAEKLAAARQDLPPGEYTVFVEFTADWCATCKVNEQVALDTEATRKKLEELNIIAIKADITREVPFVKEHLSALGNKIGGIPFIAVFPAKDPSNWITQDGLLSQARVLEMLDEGGPSIVEGDKPLQPHTEEIAWEPYVFDRFSKYTNLKFDDNGNLVRAAEDAPSANATAQTLPQGDYTVMLQFAADWDATSKVNEVVALHTEATREKLADSNIVTIKADMTNRLPDALEHLRALGNRIGAIPFVAIFPANDPTRWITQNGLLSQERLLEMLDEAGPSVVKGNKPLQLHGEEIAWEPYTLERFSQCTGLQFDASGNLVRMGDGAANAVSITPVVNTAGGRAHAEQ